MLIGNLPARCNQSDDSDGADQERQETGKAPYENQGATDVDEHARPTKITPHALPKRRRTNHHGNEPDGCQQARQDKQVERCPAPTSPDSCHEDCVGSDITILNELDMVGEKPAACAPVSPR
jgi:hypothetical protein